MSFQEVLLDRIIEHAPLERAGNRELPILSMTMHEGLIDQSSKFKKRVASADTSEYKLVCRNQLVVGFPIDEGVLSFQDLYDEAMVSPAYDTWRLREDIEIDPSYLERFLRSPRALAFYRVKLRGTTARRRTLPDDIFLKLAVPLPSLPAQQRIAAVLDMADVLRAKRRATLALLDTLTQSIFLDMFGDLIVNGWRMTTIAGVASDADGAIRTGPFGSQLLHSEFSDDGIAVLGIDNAVENEFRWGQRRFISAAKYRQLVRYTVHPGDVLITIMGTCGRCAIVPDDIPVAINTKHLCCITLNRTKCLPTFLHSYFLLHPLARRYLAQKAKGAIMEGLNMGIIKEMPVPLAPVHLQEEFAQRLKTVNQVKAGQLLSEAELETLFASLQHRAFLGEL